MCNIVFTNVKLHIFHNFDLVGIYQLIFLYKELVLLHFSFMLSNLKGNLLNNVILNNLLLQVVKFKLELPCSVMIGNFQLAI